MKKCLSIVADQNTKILIVGTAPGEQSIEKQEYYSNKNNRFWRIIFECLGVEDPINYNKRIALLLENQIGLWDVYKSFEREGSNDKKMNHLNSNDFSNLDSSIKVIITNGKKPMEKLKRAISNSHTVLLYCFSTSSSNATITQKQILYDWKKSLHLAKQAK